MKPNISSTKLIIRLLIVLIILTVLIIFSTFLYSFRYWPDVYNYIHANITIKRIPTISEIKVSCDDTTEYYTTTDIYDVESTTDIDNIENFTSDIINRPKRKVNVEEVKDYIELPQLVTVDYVFDIDNDTITSDCRSNKDCNELMNDEANVSYLTTSDMKDVEFVTGRSFIVIENLKDNSTCHRNKDVADVFSWIAAIFVKNTTDQFEYRCDGALLSSTVVITAARCVESTRAEDVIIILGKTSLNITKDTEKIVRVNNIIVHENFTASDDDIASLQIDAADETETISVSCLGDELDYDKAMTTGWAVSGDLTPIYFNKKKSESCQMSRKICGAYGNDVVVCPSYGGIFATERNKTWHLLGIRSTISSRGNFCVHEPVYYTRLCDYAEWLVDLI
ncbi:uncharacterized protein LOC126972974 isoform X2 [Leptidea sinapis]|uniref:uncharacterized protein LOC126972974 isoform X2 n=1 Tax=Leptidea sinapis TaxID=189913 RepID=UPI002135935F|nr:uncharacterized protein LOC126972974 isoform X2 [Leptidea sinapis]